MRVVFRIVFRFWDKVMASFNVGVVRKCSRKWLNYAKSFIANKENGKYQEKSKKGVDKRRWA